MQKIQCEPIKIERNGASGLVISWSNGRVSELKSEELRNNCSCATCKEARGDGSHAKPLIGKKSSLKIIEHTKDEELHLVKVNAVGNYAISITWGDGHNTGIYTFDLLRSLSGKNQPNL